MLDARCSIGVSFREPLLAELYGSEIRIKIPRSKHRIFVRRSRAGTGANQASRITRALVSDTRVSNF